MNIPHEHSGCSLRECPRPATRSERGRVGHWRIEIPYCEEHARELREGVPLGPLGINPCQLHVDPVGTKVPRVGGSFPGID
jgi:hypothetical protein